MGSIEIEAIATRVRGIGLQRAALKKKKNPITYIFSSFATNYIPLYLDSRGDMVVSVILTLSSS